LQWEIIKALVVLVVLENIDFGNIEAHGRRKSHE
jgi:hypothetical protein